MPCGEWKTKELLMCVKLRQKKDIVRKFRFAVLTRNPTRKFRVGDITINNFLFEKVSNLRTLSQNSKILYNIVPLF